MNEIDRYCQDYVARICVPMKKLHNLFGGRGLSHDKLAGLAHDEIQSLRKQVVSLSLLWADKDTIFALNRRVQELKGTNENLREMKLDLSAEVVRLKAIVKALNETSDYYHKAMVDRNTRIRAAAAILNDN